jgi:hypothetical protein
MQVEFKVSIELASGMPHAYYVRASNTARACSLAFDRLRGELGLATPHLLGVGQTAVMRVHRTKPRKDGEQ